jgi:hypothetical protein
MLDFITPSYVGFGVAAAHHSAAVLAPRNSHDNGEF